jgi:hypothetical protein
LTIPVYKIETYTGAVLDHTITKGAISVYFKEVVTDGVGYFTFTVPTVKGVPNPYYYNDITINDTVKIWIEYDSVSGNPDFIGKVGKITAPLSKTGYTRQISGLSQGEILLRRLKKNKFWVGTGASTIVTELANDLSLGTGEITADATAITLEVKTQRYFDVLKNVSDYWASAGTQVKKDFYVDVDNDLVWKSRPFRSSGVETFAIGDNIIDYNVTKDVDAVRNKISVYGAAETFLPADRDSWTESLTDWTATEGSLSLEGTSKKVGTYAIKCATTVADKKAQFDRALPLTNLRDINSLLFWRTYSGINASTYEVRLFAPDASNRFNSTSIGSGGNWEYKTLSLGTRHEYDVNLNPDGIWTKTGSPNWYNIQGIEFYADFAAANPNVIVDALHFAPVRYSGSAEDGTSQTDYEIREAEFTDDSLLSDTDCDKRAETRLYQLKDLPVQIDVTIKGNPNVFVGDRISMTIPAEGISAVDYDVISVEQVISNETHYITRATMVNTPNIREPIETNPIRMLSNLQSSMRQLAADIKLIE